MKARGEEMDQEQSLKSPANIERRFLELPALWLRIGQMNESFFSAELPRASVSNTLFSVLLVTGCTVILTVVGALIGSIIGYSKAPAGANSVHAARIAGNIAILFSCCGLIITPISFYLNNGITYISALLFGGKGKYSSQAYLDSLFYVPLGVGGGLIGLLSAIPTFGLYIVAVTTLGIAIYAVILRVRAFKVVHGFSTGRAIAAVLTPFVLLLIPLCMIALLTLTGPAIGNAFSTINSQLGTPMP